MSCTVALRIASLAASFRRRPVCGRTGLALPGGWAPVAFMIAIIAFDETWILGKTLSRRIVS
jgi:hypothetical protein